ncbi:uncharacterized protein LOC141631211 [Silene latifolia]|uniref:uncharacterized protein LOC141631211 n=1 Tax=Silene latifolia TaxID=37657 RepID=UPI003D773D49
MSLEESVKDLKNALSILTDRLSSIEDKIKDDGSGEDDLTKKLKDMEKLIKRNTKYADLLDVECNMPNMRGRLPPKFTTADLPKFKGTEHPAHHLRSFVQAMALKEVDASVFPAIFPSTLEDVARSWFFSLDPTRVSNWEDIKKEFLTQYSSNADLLITRRDLEVTKQTEKEGFTDFLARWRNKAAKMIERPPEAEQVDIFVKNLREPYKSHLRYAGIESFARLNKIGIQIEDDVVESTAKNQTKVCFKDKKNFASTSKGGDIVNTVEQKPRREFTDLGMSLSRALDRLIKEGYIKPIGPTPDPANKSPKWRENEYCKYHRGKGHDTDYCFTLRNAIQNLIDNRTIPLPKAARKPNNNKNPLGDVKPSHR